MTPAAVAPADQLGQLQLLDLSSLEVSKFNPRKIPGDLTELAASIKEIGVVEPIVAVRREGGGFDIIAGSRRSAAARKAGLTQIPARILELSDAQAMAASLIENLQRKDLEPLEEAQAFFDYIALTGCTQKELGERVGRAPSTIANALRILDAPKPVKSILAKGEIDAAHAREFLKLVDPGLAERAIEVTRHMGGRDQERITVRDVAHAVETVNEQHAEAQVLATVKPDLQARRDDIAAKGKTVTWEPARGYDKKWEVATYLGEPPKKIAVAFDSYEGEKWTTHEKDCGCESVALTLGGGYGRDAHKIATKKVCTNAGAFRKFRQKKGFSSGTNRQQREAKARANPARVRDQIKRQWTIRDARVMRSSEAKKIVSKSLTADLLRALVIKDGVSSGGSAFDERVIELVETMSPAQLAKHLAIEIADEIAQLASYERSTITAQKAWLIRTFKLDAAKVGYPAKAIENCRYPLTTAAPAKKTAKAKRKAA